MDGTVVQFPPPVEVVEGPPGPQGPPGPVGPKGQPRFTGSGPPGTIVGAEPGDVYMDLDTGTCYKLM